MSMALLDTTVIILRSRQDGVDRQNRPKWVWEPVGEVRARREMQQSQEVATSEGEEEVANWLFWLEPTYPVRSRDRLRHYSGDYEVVGPPEDWAQPADYGAFPHLEAQARFLGTSA